MTSCFVKYVSLFVIVHVLNGDRIAHVKVADLSRVVYKIRNLEIRN